MAVVDRSAKEKLEIPHEPGEWIEVSPLTGGQMAEARVAYASRLLQRMIDRGADMSKILEDVDTAEKDQTSAVANPTFDDDTLLKFAVQGWSYDVPPTEENILNLDYPTREWLLPEIKQRNTFGPLSKN